MRCHYTTIFCLRNLVRCSQLRYPFPGAKMNLLRARHGRVHKPVPFSPRGFQGFHVFFVIWINKVDSSLSSFGFSFSILVFLFFERLFQCGVNLSPSAPRQHKFKSVPACSSSPARLGDRGSTVTPAPLQPRCKSVEQCTPRSASPSLGPQGCFPKCFILCKRFSLTRPTS